MTADAATVAARRERVLALVAELPETSANGEQHLSLEVRGRRFGWLQDDHHGDGRCALVCRATPGRNAALVAADPERWFLPPYTAARGWVGLHLDLDAEPDWDELADAYRMSAPKRLAALLDALPARSRRP